jgi:hypothetical protein
MFDESHLLQETIALSPTDVATYWLICLLYMCYYVYMYTWLHNRCVGHHEELAAVIRAMQESGSGPDFITVDGALVHCQYTTTLLLHV